MTETEDPAPHSRKATLLLLATGVIAALVTLGVNIDVLGAVQVLLGTS